MSSSKFVSERSVSTARAGATRGRFAVAALLAAACLAPAAMGQTAYTETEANDSKAAANGPFLMASGDTITGFSTGSSTSVPGNGSADYFLVQTASAPLGFYQHRLVITTAGTAGHTGTLRGLTQSSGVINPGTDSALQTSATTTSPPRYVQWYGFGKQEMIYFRVTGTASTTSDYVATLETIPVSTIDLGTYYNGTITIDRPEGVTTDIDFWVYDSNLNAIADYGNDTPNALTRNFSPGTYYIAYTNFNFANNQPAASDEGFLSGSVWDFADGASCSSTTLAPTLGIRLTDAFNQVSTPTPKNSQFDVVWLQFTVTDTPPATGACCLADGTCIQATSSGCAGQGGVFNGDNSDCGSVVCAQPGACCFANFTCTVLSAAECLTAGGTYLGDSTACDACPPPPPGVHPEMEPNDAKFDADGPFVLAPGNSIVGLTTGSSTATPGDASADNFIVTTTPAPLGIYQHKLVITTDGALGHTGTIRGLTQSSGAINPGTDSVLQTTSTATSPPRALQWYGFGKEESLYVRVTGTASTTGTYAATLETTPVTPINLGTFYNGTITIDRPEGVTTDTDFWVYDSNLNAIPDYGNDDPNTLTRTYGVGTYYIAYSNFNTANDQPTPTDETFLSASVTDFPNVVTNSSTSVFPSMGVRITDAFDQVSVATPKENQFDVVWLQFTVGDVPPTTGACCLLDGTCVQATPAGCASQNGAYQGDNVDCGTVACPQPGACCLTNFTCSILAASECAALGGNFLGENTVCGDCPPPPPGSVAILAADSAGNIEDIRSKLAATGMFPMVLTPDVGTTGSTPTLEFLQQFDAVLVFSNQSFADAVGMGNVLADYVDAGGGVVVSMFTLSTTNSARFLGGRWDETYQIVPQQSGNFTGAGAGLGTILVPGHPILASVNTFLGGTSGYRPTTTDLTSHGVKVAEWTDGKTLIAVSSTRPNRADIGFFPPSSDVGTANWDSSTDGARILANALAYTIGDDEGCLADWNLDTLVNSSDISAFLTSWLDSIQNGNLIADFNIDGVVNSSDISAFLTAWLDAIQNGC